MATPEQHLTSSYSGGSGGDCIEAGDSLTHAARRTSTYSGGDEGTCVEVADNLPDVIPVRDNKDPDGPVPQGRRPGRSRARRGEPQTGRMYATYALTEAQGRLGELARRAARHERIMLTSRGEPTAVLISPTELEDLEDALAVVRLERDRALGRAEALVPHDAARRALRDALREAERRLP